MCNIAGYIGDKPAAPILIDMIKRQEYLDGGLSTGIATVDNGVLHFAKVTGNAEELIKKTDAMNFPGTSGIIHSRPDDNYVKYAHPFLCENNKTAVVSNGNLCTDENLATIRNSVARFLDILCEVKFESAMKLPRSSYPQLKDGRFVAYAEVFAKTVEHLKSTANLSYAEAMADASSKLFSDVVNVLISANSPENIYVARISRPMNIMVANGESYISTSQLGFPEIPDIKYIKSLPQMESCTVSRDGFTTCDIPISGGKVTDYSPEEYIKIKDALKEKFKKIPTSMDSMGGGIFTVDRSADKLRPHVKLIYDILWEFHKEGILKSEIKYSTIPWIPGKTVKRTFFYI